MCQILLILKISYQKEYVLYKVWVESLMSCCKPNCDAAESICCLCVWFYHWFTRFSIIAPNSCRKDFFQETKAKVQMIIIQHVPWRKCLMNLALSIVHLSTCLSVGNPRSQNLLFSFFYFFCMKLDVHNAKKIVRPNFWYKLSLSQEVPASPKNDQKWGFWGFDKIESIHMYFFYLNIKVLMTF